MGKRPVTVRMARWSAEHPWRAIALWMVFVAVCFVGGNMAGTHEATAQDDAIGESGRAYVMIEEGQFADEPAVDNVLITAPTGRLDVKAAEAAAKDAATKLGTVTGVEKVGDPIPSRDGTALLVPITMTGDPDTAPDRVEPLRAATAEVQKAHPDLRVEEVGGPSIEKALNDTLGKDFQKAEILSLPVTLAILILAFGALIAAGVPVLLALSSVVAAMGLSTLASHLVPMGDATGSVILLIGMAVGIDYSLFYVKREREERAKGRGHVDAVEIAAETSGHAVVVSGTAVIIAMAGLFLARDSTFSSLATGSILVVAVAVIGSLTVLPALLAKLGRWVDRPRVPLIWRLTKNTNGEGRVWRKILNPALKKPAITLVVSVLALLALAAPAIGMKLKFPGTEDLPRTTPAMQAYDRLAAAYPSNGTTHVVAVQAPAAEAATVKAALTKLAGSTQGDPLFAQLEATGPKIDVSADRTVSVMELATPFSSRSEKGADSLHELRQKLAPAALSGIPGAKYAVAGDVAENEDYAKHIWQTLPIVAGFVLALTFLVMAWTFRSVVVAATSILLNLLSAGAAYGLLVVVFQNHWAEGLLGFTSMGAIVTWLPLFLFVVLFGLSMDYHVFVVSRIREAVGRGVPTREAVAEGIAGSAGTVSSAAIVMVAVFSIFATLSTIDMKQLGIGLAAAILLDATIIRAVVLPSLMTLLGPANWWAPRFMRPRGRHAATAAVPEERERELVGAP
ncbi:MMPL family transporter [Paractinoplanes globisporus]|uniref:MMPL family transporter n=1 Tax=Paractinoplanes globisporus TaxID=113565 RepID=A0ABW6WBA1_9ACTN|nr:MMPL family transporter [Actinoplanes globisporus]